jgi:DMSO/TMAO reductase YedYZ molybdopterin-dependent catalytic subunit
MSTDDERADPATEWDKLTAGTGAGINGDGRADRVSSCVTARANDGGGARPNDGGGARVDGAGGSPGSGGVNRGHRVPLFRDPATWWAALAGIVSAVVVLAVAEVIAVFLGLAGSPLFAVGAWVIDLVPGWLKDAVIQAFGTADKVVLLGVLAVLVLLLAAAAGIAQYRRAPWGVVILVAVSAIAALAVTTRPEATGVDAIPTVVGMIAGAVLLRQAVRALADWRESAARERGTVARSGGLAQLDRRKFLGLTLIAGVAAAAAGAGARAFNQAVTYVSDLRAKISLPAAATTEAPAPAGAELDIDGVVSYITPNEEFYRIDTALQVPNIDPDAWSLKITGMVDREVEITFDELLAKPLIEHTTTLACVSNEVGGTLIGNAVWLGYPIRELLAEAGVQAGADMVLSRSEDGFTASTPLEVLQDEGREALLAVGMNGEPLPLEHGFPVRMVVPGLYGYVSATKWVVELSVTTFATETAYWTDRGWGERGPIKQSSRIDTPRQLGKIAPGRTAVAGVAWAQHTGIRAVDVRIDDGPWQPARLADTVGPDTWVQWVYDWDAAAGQHQVQVRSTDASGQQQTEALAGVLPDGATGLHTITVNVG